MKKDYYVQEEDGELIVNTVYKDGNQYVQHVRNGQSCDKLLLLNSPKCTMLKDIIKEIKAFLV